jgi:hypothetical protein
MRRSPAWVRGFRPNQPHCYYRTDSTRREQLPALISGITLELKQPPTPHDTEDNPRRGHGAVDPLRHRLTQLVIFEAGILRELGPYPVLDSLRPRTKRLLVVKHFVSQSPPKPPNYPPRCLPSLSCPPSLLFPSRFRAKRYRGNSMVGRLVSRGVPRAVSGREKHQRAGASCETSGRATVPVVVTRRT